MRQDFKGSIYWDELAEICGEISRVAGFQDAARFQGNTVYIKEPVRCRTVKYRFHLLPKGLKQLAHDIEESEEATASEIGYEQLGGLYH